MSTHTDDLPPLPDAAMASWSEHVPDLFTAQQMHTYARAALAAAPAQPAEPQLMLSHYLANRPAIPAPAEWATRSVWFRFGDQAEAVELVPAKPLTERVAELEAALRDIADDYEDRFDMSSPSTNPGMKYVVAQARAILAAAQEPKP
jgi:ADP-ribose pyrophosphatase YjhB (NUDIX family)